MLHLPPVYEGLEFIENNWKLACIRYNERHYRTAHMLFKRIESIFTTKRCNPPLVLLNNILCLNKILGITNHQQLTENARQLSKDAHSLFNTYANQKEFSIVKKHNLQNLPQIINNCKVISSISFCHALIIIPYPGIIAQYAFGYLR